MSYSSGTGTLESETPLQQQTEDPARKQLIHDLATLYNWTDAEDIAPNTFRVMRKATRVLKDGDFIRTDEAAVRPNDLFSDAQAAGLVSKLDASHCAILDREMLEAIETQRLAAQYRWEKTEEADIYKVTRNDLKNPGLRESDKIRIDNYHGFAKLLDNGSVMIVNPRLAQAVKAQLETPEAGWAASLGSGSNRGR